MNPDSRASPPAWTAEHVQRLLDVTRRLASPVELHTLLREVTAASRELLAAERASVWLLDEPTGELVLEIAADIEAVRISTAVGLSGACARERAVIEVPDCYADPRFDPSIDRRSGFRTRNSISLPLLALDDRLVGVLQVLNRAEPGDPASRPLAEALAAQCAVALERARGLQRLRDLERMRRDLELARQMQGSALPRHWPAVEGYALHATFRPAEQTGGDIFDLVPQAGRLMLVLADATGHGIGPAISVTQMQAMLRFGLRSGAALPEVFRHVNDELCERLPDGHFVTAFVGLLDPVQHRVDFISGGQAPILHYVAAEDRFVRLRATSFPMGAMPMDELPRPACIALAPGDWLLLISDGVFEQESPGGEAFGRDRVEAIVRSAPQRPPDAAAAALLQALLAFSHDRQDDDVTMIMLRRDH